MFSSLALLFVLSFPAPPDTAQLAVEAEFLKKSQLPDEFQFPILELDFAVMQVKITNQGQEAWTLTPSGIVVQDPKGKALEPAASTEITPKIMRSDVFRRSNRNIHGTAGPGYRGIYEPGIYIPPGPNNPRIPSGAKTVSAGAAQQIRAVLEESQLKEGRVPPGGSVEGLLYFKSKKPAHELGGSVLLIGDLRVTAGPSPR